MLSTPIKRVGILFSGGPAPAANAVISAATLAFLDAGISVIGFYDGYENLVRWSADAPLVEGEDYIQLRRDDVSHIRSHGAIVLRTARANPGKAVETLDDLSDSEKNAKLRAVFGAFEQLEVDALISIGGDDTLKTANYLLAMQDAVPGLRPLRIVHLPKTIDNDYNGIDWTFGFMTAADFISREVRNLVADGKSTSTWWVLEVMGRKAGWLTYAAGIAGAATKMISVEDCDDIYDVERSAEEIARLVLARAKDGRDHGVVCIAEGLADKLPDDQRPKSTDEHGNAVLASVQIGSTLTEAIERAYERLTGGEKLRMRSKQLGYEARCAEPNAFDVLLGTQLGVGASRALVDEGLTGVMVSVEGQLQLTYVPFADLIDPDTLKTKVRFIECDSDFYRLARSLEYRVSE